MLFFPKENHQKLIGFSYYVQKKPLNACKISAEFNGKRMLQRKVSA